MTTEPKDSLQYTPYAISAHKRISEQINNLKTRLSEIFGKVPDGEHSLDIPRVNLLYFAPRHQAYYHIMPFGRHEYDETLPGSQSSFLQQLVKPEESLGYLTPPELATLATNAMRFPHVRDGVAQLIQLDIPARLSISDEPQELLRTLLSRFNEAPFLSIRSWEDECDAHQVRGIVHALLSATPQFDKVRWAVLSTDAPWTSTQGKLDIITEARNDFIDLGMLLPFKERCFLLLTAIESLQWGVGHSFEIVHDLFRQCRKAAIASGTGLALRQMKIYFHGAYEFDPLAYLGDVQKKPSPQGQVRAALEEHSIAAARILAELFVEYEQRQLSVRGDGELEFPAFLARGLLTFVRPSWLAIVSREVKGRIQKPITSFDGDNRAAEHLLANSWGTYERDSSNDALAEAMHKRTLRGNRELVIGPESVGIPAEGPFSEHGTLVLGFDDEELADFLSLRTCCVSLVRRLENAFSLSQPALHDRHWYVRAFHSLYRAFDEQRQKAEDFADRRNHEIAFLDEFLPADKSSASLVVDIGAGYGRIAKSLLSMRPTLQLIAIDLSQELLEAFRSSLDPDDVGRVGWHTCEFLHIGPLAATTEADIAIMMFSTFGCYDDDEDNRRLLGLAYDMLKPGGTLIIEQFNPQRVRPTNIDVSLEASCRGVNWKLAKSSVYVHQPSYCHYHGHYCYYTDADAYNRRIDYYSLRLYTRRWFADCAGQLTPSPRLGVFGGFAPELRGYKHETSDLMIICLAKPFSEIERKTARTWLKTLADNLDAEYGSGLPDGIELASFAETTARIEVLLRSAIIEKCPNVPTEEAKLRLLAREVYGLFGEQA